MAVCKLGSSWWVDFRACGTRHRVRSPENSRRGAAAFELLLRQRLARGEPLRPAAAKSVPTFAEFVVVWFDTYVQTNNKHSERANKAMLLRCHLVPFFGRSALTEISASQIEQYKAVKLAAGLAPKTVNNHLIALGKCLRCAEDWDVLPKRPRIQMLRGTSVRLDFLSQLETTQLLSDDSESMWREMVLVALRTGMRRGELLGLDWSDVDLERRMLTVSRSCVLGVIGSPKSNRIRHIPLSSDVVQALSTRRRRHGLVFSADADGIVLLTKSNVASALDRLCKRAGVRRVTWHVLRHTFASQLVAAGVSLPTVQELLGHASITMTMRYVHLAPSALQEAVDRLLKVEAESLANRWPMPAPTTHLLARDLRPIPSEISLKKAENAPRRGALSLVGRPGIEHCPEALEN